MTYIAPIDRAHAAPVSDHAFLAQAEAADARELEQVERYDAIMRRAHVRPGYSDDSVSGIVLICMAVLLLCFAAFILLLPVEAGALGWREL